MSLQARAAGTPAAPASLHMGAAWAQPSCLILQSLQGPRAQDSMGCMKRRRVLGKQAALAVQAPPCLCRGHLVRPASGRGAWGLLRKPAVRARLVLVGIGSVEYTGLAAHLGVSIYAATGTASTLRLGHNSRLINNTQHPLILRDALQPDRPLLCHIQYFPAPCDMVYVQGVGGPASRMLRR